MISVHRTLFPLFWCVLGSIPSVLIFYSQRVLSPSQGSKPREKDLTLFLPLFFDSPVFFFPDRSVKMGISNVLHGLWPKSHTTGFPFTFLLFPVLPNYPSRPSRLRSASPDCTNSAKSKEFANRQAQPRFPLLDLSLY